MLVNFLGSLCILVDLKTCGSLGKVLFSFKISNETWAQQTFHFSRKSSLRKLSVPAWWWTATDISLQCPETVESSEEADEWRALVPVKREEHFVLRYCCAGRNTKSPSDNFCKCLHGFKNWELINSTENVQLGQWKCISNTRNDSPRTNYTIIQNHSRPVLNCCEKFLFMYLIDE